MIEKRGATCFYTLEGWRGKRRGENKTRKISKLPFLTYISKIKLTHPLFGAWSLVLIHVQLTPSGSTKSFKNCISQKSDHGSVNMKETHLT
jgi:hypothetical protein